MIVLVLMHYRFYTVGTLNSTPNGVKLAIVFFLSSHLQDLYQAKHPKKFLIKNSFYRQKWTKMIDVLL